MKVWYGIASSEEEQKIDRVSQLSVYINGDNNTKPNRVWARDYGVGHVEIDIFHDAWVCIDAMLLIKEVGC
ncbi:hypothetical protein [Spiroplasma endosymbiont of Clivina fossor]|uniref:hypothetical protein n=1 Tax=Spiroplasma endosymbiont of Clivina fossor TaxID=3066282 RepID=UPI00313B7555